jgi:hypothetical protein
MLKISTKECIESMTRNEQSAFLYAESCLVDYSGLLESQRINSEDIEAFDKFKKLGIIDFGRIPAALLSSSSPRKSAHWVTFSEKAWSIAFALRRLRAENTSERRKAIDAIVSERDIASA